LYYFAFASNAAICGSVDVSSKKWPFDQHPVYKLNNKVIWQCQIKCSRFSISDY